jgi:hypothetical protein
MSHATAKLGAATHMAVTEIDVKFDVPQRSLGGNNFEVESFQRLLPHLAAVHSAVITASLPLSLSTAVDWFNDLPPYAVWSLIVCETNFGLEDLFCYVSRQMNLARIGTAFSQVSFNAGWVVACWRF